MVKLASGPIMDFLKAYGVAAITAFLADAAVEATKFPHLDLIPSGQDDSNFEQYVYFGGTGLVVAGLAALMARKDIVGIGKWAIPVGLGMIFGTFAYEQKGHKWLGIRRGGQLTLPG